MYTHAKKDRIHMLKTDFGNTLSQLAFPVESDPNFQWDDTVMKIFNKFLQQDNKWINGREKCSLLFHIPSGIEQTDPSKPTNESY